MVTISEVPQQQDAPTKRPTDPAVAYQMVLDAVLKSTGDDETFAQLKMSLEAMHKSPPFKSVSAQLNRDVDAEAVRRMLFCPTPEDMGTYARLLVGASCLLYTSPSPRDS
eukprot:TRINITY_DN41272_c0_g1_i1.p1 TRINITY_DN41272_c0_g1~~TRINITY_DN41272_c0_g1_i1.p1  ORF type:complete len:110 (-),score=27.75 TRINITY_DN41272_c0_g1_i1:97-426(-)